MHGIYINITPSQDRQCTYNVTFKRVRAAGVAVGKSRTTQHVCL